MPFRGRFESLDDPPQLVHDLGREAYLAQALVNTTIPPDRAVAADIEAAPHGVRIDRPLQIGDDCPRVVQLVGGTDPTRRFTRIGQTLEVILFAFLARQIGAVIIERSLRYGEYGVEDVHSELVANALPQHVPRVMLPNAVFDNVVEYAGNYGILISAITSKDDRHVGRMRQIRQTSALANLSVMVLGRECQGVIDSIRVPVHRHRVCKLARGTGECILE